MDTTRTTLWGALILVALAVGVFVARAHYLGQRDACQRRLAALAPALERYATAHTRRLPATPAELAEAVGSAPLSTIDGLPYQMAPAPLRWKVGKPRPYLWDPRAHPFVNGVHVLYTDGSVRIEKSPPPASDDAR